MRVILIVLGAALLAACTTSSGVMNAGNGTYMISTHAAPIRGGASKSTRLAYEEAQEFCAKKQLHAEILTNNERDTYQGSFGPYGGGVFAAGNTNMRFRCT